MGLWSSIGGVLGGVGGFLAGGPLGAGVGVGVGGNLFGSLSGEDNEAVEKASNAQIDAMHLQNQFNVQNWNLQNAYNTPSAQRDRLEAAGLNANLAYGQIAESRAASVPGVSSPDLGSISMQGADLKLRRQQQTLGALSDYQQIVNMSQQNSLTKVQTDKAKADAKAAKSNAEYTEYENDSYMKNGTFKNDFPWWRFMNRVFDRPGMAGAKATMQTDFQNR